MSKMKEIQDPNELIIGKNYYIQKTSESGNRKVINHGKALGVHFNGTEPYDKETHYYPEDGAVLGWSTIAGAFREGEPLVRFKQVIPLNPNGANLAKVTHFKPYHTHQTDYKRYLGYKFYEVTEDELYNRVVDDLSKGHLFKRAPRLSEFDALLIKRYLGTLRASPSGSKSAHSKSAHSKSAHSKSAHSKSAHSKSAAGTKSNSKKGDKFKKGGRRTRKKSHNRKTKRLIH